MRGSRPRSSARRTYRNALPHISQAYSDLTSPSIAKTFPLWVITGLRQEGQRRSRVSRMPPSWLDPRARRAMRRTALRCTCRATSARISREDARS